MNAFIYNYIGELLGSATVIFLTSKYLSEEDLTSEIKHFHDTNHRCEKSVCIYPMGFYTEEELSNVVSSSTNTSLESITLIPYNENGVTDESPLTKDLFYQGNLHIIKKTNIILHSDSNFHYVNPSHKHSPYFIRTANMLVRNEEINFIAIQLLTYFKEADPTEIVCDTSSILAIPYALVYLRSVFKKEINVPIRSFGSYAHKEYNFKRSSLVIISASNSGRLEDDIRISETDIKIVTIIFNSNNTKQIKSTIHRNILLNINSTFSDLIPNNHKKKQFDRSEDCEYCSNNSIPVMVRDDQFMPSRVLIQKVIIKKYHYDLNFIRSINEFTCSKSIIAYKSEYLSSKIRELYFDVQNLIEHNGSFAEAYRKIIKNSLPASSNLIVHIDDKSSTYMANYILNYLNEILKLDIPKIVSFKDISTLQDVESYSTIIVVASCLSTGNLLNAVAQSLRRFKKSSIHYIVGLARLENSEKLKLLRSNIEARQGNIELNKLHTVSECFLPNNHSKHSTKYLQPSWIQEEKLLSQWIDAYPTYSEFLLNRKKAINRLNGLSIDLYYCDPFSKTRLSLRPNFIFYDFKQDTPSQADVYFIIASVMHCLRNPKMLSERKVEDKFLLQHEHVKSLIAPDNFTRFNDGVIQASILRIARPSELDYSVDEEHSSEILGIMKILFTKENLVSAEGILEFLYAMASRKLKMNESHIYEFIDFLKKQFTENDSINFFIIVIETEILRGYKPNIV
ncbi:MAG TPA: hypothetical protein VL443_15730 [Cyclobacteriaceae bacterium]|jgi:hypothetical protein|nr:hypothetical protein [Cyclobacteriaceae bacterium]